MNGFDIISGYSGIDSSTVDNLKTYSHDIGNNKNDNMDYDDEINQLIPNESDQIIRDELMAKKLQRIENALMPIYPNQIPPKEQMIKKIKINEMNKNLLPPYRSMITPLNDLNEEIIFDDPPFNANSSSSISGGGGGGGVGGGNVRRNNSKIISMIMTTNTTIKQKFFEAANDTLSIKSLSMSMKSSSNMVNGKKLNISFDKVPIEIKGLIVNELRDDQRSLVNCLYVNKSMYSVTLKVLYQHPKIYTSYRLGQFVTSIMTSNNGLGGLVKLLDLSQIDYAIQMTAEEKFKFQDQLIFGTVENTNGFEGRIILAGWRDWKYREHPLYSMLMDGRRKSFTSYDSMSGLTLVNRSRSNSGNGSLINCKNGEEGKILHYIKKILKVKKGGLNGPQLGKEEVKVNNNLDNKPKLIMKTKKPHHPIQNHFLREYTFQRDIPIGYILHLIDECKQLEEINLSYIQVSKDFKIKNLTGIEEYWSDSSRELNDFQEGELEIITMGSVWKGMLDLKELKIVKLDGIPSVELNTIKSFLFESSFKSNLKELHCRDSGMVKRPQWGELRLSRQWRRSFKWK